MASQARTCSSAPSALLHCFAEKFADVFSFALSSVDLCQPSSESETFDSETRNQDLSGPIQKAFPDPVNRLCQKLSET